MYSKRPSLGSRTLRIAHVALFLIGLSPSALAANFEVISWDNTPDNGTFPWAIGQVNATDQDENTIFFNAVLVEKLSVPTDNALPAIELVQFTHSVELNATATATLATPFAIVREGDALAGFKILDVAKGKATIVDLKISGGDFNIQNGAKLEFKDTEAYADREVTDIIRGAGQLIKSGDQKMILSGTNTYTGGTEITGGILQGDRAGLGATDGLFTFNAAEGEADRGTLTFSDADDSENWNWNGETSGDGLVRKEGASALILTGDGFTHTGGTEITGGTLEAASEKLGSADITVSSAGTLKFKETAAQTFGSTISGAGSVRKSGNDTLTLNGSNTFSGGLTVEGGSVEGTTDSLGTGNIALNSSEVIFSQTTEGTFSGGVTGTGTLTKLGTGKLIVSGNMGDQISTTLSEGILELGGGSLDSDITATNGTTVIFQRDTSSSTFSGTISQNSVDVEKNGANKLTFEKAQAYTGSTVISGGTLVLTDDLSNTSGTTVHSGATLETQGSLSLNGNTHVNSGATLETQGTLSVNGMFTAGGALSLVDSSSALSVENTLTFANGSSLNVIVEQGGNAPIESNTAITGTLTNVVVTSTEACNDCKLLKAPLDNIDESVVSNSLNWQSSATRVVQGVQVLSEGGFDFVFFDLVDDPGAIIQAAQTKNQIATAPAMVHVYLEGGPGSPIYDAISALPDDYALRSAMDQMAGESLAAFTTARESNAQQFAHALWQRFRSSEYRPGWYDFKENESSEGTPPVSAPASSPESASDTPRLAGWAQPFGIFANNDGRGKASDIESRVYGLFGGVDYALPDSTGLKVGVALGYTRYSIFSESQSDMQGQANTYQAALYGAWQNRHFHVGVSGRYGYTNMRSQRRLAFFQDVTADARFSGQEYGGMIEIGATLGNPTFFSVRPIVAFQYDRFTQGSFRESGAGPLSLSVDRQDYTSLLTTLGTRISKLYTFKGGFGIEPEIRVGWTYQAGDKARPITAATYNVPFSPTFTTYGAEADRNAIWVGAGYVMRTTDTVRVGLDYDAYIGKYYTQQVVSAELQIIW